jgi:hypothetical protein
MKAAYHRWDLLLSIAVGLLLVVGQPLAEQTP